MFQHHCSKKSSISCHSFSLFSEWQWGKDWRKNNKVWETTIHFTWQWLTFWMTLCKTSPLTMGFDDGLLTVMILIDLQKTFDAINHDILLKKLLVYCIIAFSDHTVKWFQSYLSNWKFMVNLENSFSEVSSISCGVRQESLLGPLFFLSTFMIWPWQLNVIYSYIPMTHA